MADHNWEEAIVQELRLLVGSVASLYSRTSIRSTCRVQEQQKLVCIME